MALTIIGPNDPALDALDAALAARPDLDARLHIIPWPDYRDTLMTGLAADESPWQAAFIPGHIWLPELAEKGLLAPLGPMMAEASESARAQYAAGDVIPAVAAECRYADADYLLPLFSDGHILFYLEKYFDFSDRGHPPVISTREIAALASRAHRPPHHFGLALKADVSEIFTDWLPYLWEADGRIFDDAGRPDIANPVNIAALKAYCSLRAHCPPETHRYGNAEIAEAIRNGSAALVATWGGQAAPIFLDGAPPHHYHAAVFPAPWNATWGAGIPANQARASQQQTIDALMRVMGPETDRAVIRTAGSPVRESSYTPEALARYPWLAAQRAMLERARALPADPRLGLFLGDLYEFVHRAFTGEMTPAAALQTVQKRAQAALAEI